MAEENEVVITDDKSSLYDYLGRPVPGLPRDPRDPRDPPPNRPAPGTKFTATIETIDEDRAGALFSIFGIA